MLVQENDFVSCIQSIEWEDDDWEDEDAFKVDQSLLTIDGYVTPDEDEEVTDDTATVARVKKSEAFRRYGAPAFMLPAIVIAHAEKAKALAKGDTMASLKSTFQSQRSHVAQALFRSKSPPAPPHPENDSEAENAEAVTNRRLPPADGGKTSPITGVQKPKVVRQAELQREAIERENMQLITDMMKELAQKDVVRKDTRVLINPIGEHRYMAREIVDTLKERLRAQRLNAPTRIYKTKQKLLPLVLQLV